MAVAAGTRGLAASDISAVAGWYGKLPSLGDFASRRLEGDFIDAWDLWLGERLQALKESRGAAWLDAYLHSPPWRFLLTPGVLTGFDGRQVLAGVLLSSVDRVGRYFPLTIVAALPAVPTSAQEIGALLAWMQRIENMALDALHAEWGIDALENALDGLPPPARQASVAADDPLDSAMRELASALADGGGAVELAPAAARQDLATVISGAMNPAAASSRVVAGQPSTLRGIALWLADGPERQRILVTRGLPAVREFSLMFGEGPGGGQASAAPMPALIPADADLLAMFDSTPPASAPTAAAVQGGDVLGLFAASADAPKGDDGADGGDETRPGDDDILALFDALPGSGGAVQGDATQASDPDILDLFGGKPNDDEKAL